jgi:hypothetical protein
LYTPAGGALRIWTKDGTEFRKKAQIPGGDYVALGTAYKVSDLPTANLYVEAIQASTSSGDQRITVEIDPNGQNEFIASDSVRVTAARVNINISRKIGSVVPDYAEQSNGSIVQIVPNANPGFLYPIGIFLTIPLMAVEPASLAGQFTLKLQKTTSDSPGSIRIYRKRGSDTDFWRRKNLCPLPTFQRIGSWIRFPAGWWTFLW